MIRSSQLFCLVLISSCASLQAMEFDALGLQEYKAGITTMIQAGKTLEGWNNNKAITALLAEQERISNIDNPKQLFDPKRCGRINNYLTLVTTNESYQKLFADFKATIKKDSDTRTFDETKANQFRGTAARIAMEFLKEKGVRFPETPGNNKSGHASFMQVNADICPKAVKHLLAGSFLLYYFRFIQRDTVQKMVF